MFTAKDLGMGHIFWKATLSKSWLSNDINQKICEWLKKPIGFLVLFGNTGTGKTHTCASIINDRWGESNDIRFLQFGSLLERLRKTMNTTVIKDGDFEAELKIICESKHLIVDDVGMEFMNDWRKGVFSKLVQFRDETSLISPTIITTNYTDSQILETFGAPTYDRLFKTNGSLSIFFDGDSLRYREKD